MKRLEVIAAFGAILGMLGGLLTVSPALASVPASASAPGWSVTPSPNPVIPTGRLFSVSCPAANSCLAVGGYTKASGAGVALAERWNGTSWRILPAPNPARATVSFLFGVACSTPSACTAVGQAIIGGASQALAERWDGTRWSIQATPNPPQGGAFLNDVACTSASACTAVGLSSAGTLAERWNGTRWTIQGTPNPPKGGGALFSVACTSPSACTAVGASSAGTLAERWNGTHWSIQTTPNPPQGGGLLASVACTSPSACTAAGVYQDSSGAAHPLAERWDGSSWAIQPTPRLPGGAQSQLIDVACTSATGCLAVGYSYPKGGNNIQSPATLAERWDGSTWRVEHTPNPPGPAASILNAASCVSPSACIAVGNTSNSRVASLTLAQRWNGHTWSIQPIPSPADGGNLIGVSCPSRSSCLAVGGHGNPFTGPALGTLAEQWNGTTWSIQPTPNPPGGGWFLTAVSCTSPSACTAVGGRLVPPGKPTGTLAERWNGHTWSIPVSYTHLTLPTTPYV